MNVEIKPSAFDIASHLSKLNQLFLVCTTQEIETVGEKNRHNNGVLSAAVSHTYEKEKLRN